MILIIKESDFAWFTKINLAARLMDGGFRLVSNQASWALYFSLEELPAWFVVCRSRPFLDGHV